MPIYAIDDLIPVINPNSYIHPSAEIIGDVIIPQMALKKFLANLVGIVLTYSQERHEITWKKITCIVLGVANSLKCVVG